MANPKSHSLLIASLLLLTSQMTEAMADDRNQVAQLSANLADLNQKTHRGIYIGDVQFDQGTSHLRAVRASTQGNEQNKLILATAFADKNTPAHFWTQTAIGKPLLHAFANEIRYYPERHYIELIGDARVVQGEDSFSAPTITYDTVLQHVVAKNEGRKRTVIVIHPGQKHE